MRHRRPEVDSQKRLTPTRMCGLKEFQNHGAEFVGRVVRVGQRPGFCGIIPAFLQGQRGMGNQHFEDKKLFLGVSFFVVESFINSNQILKGYDFARILQKSKAPTSLLPVPMSAGHLELQALEGRVRFLGELLTGIVAVAAGPEE